MKSPFLCAVLDDGCSKVNRNIISTSLTHPIDGGKSKSKAFGRSVDFNFLLASIHKIYQRIKIQSIFCGKLFKYPDLSP